MAVRVVVRVVLTGFWGAVPKFTTELRGAYGPDLSTRFPINRPLAIIDRKLTLIPNPTFLCFAMEIFFLSVFSKIMSVESSQEYVSDHLELIGGIKL